jgi:hypothetical protein
MKLRIALMNQTLSENCCSRGNEAPSLVKARRTYL